MQNGGYTFSFNAFGTGRVNIDWYYLPRGAILSKDNRPPMLIGTGQASFPKSRLVKLTIKLTTNGKRMLKATNRLQLTAKGTYTLKGNPAVTATKTLTLKR